MLKLSPVTSCIKGQRIQLLGHIMRREVKEIVKSSIGMDLTQGKQPRKDGLTQLKKIQKH